MNKEKTIKIETNDAKSKLNNISQTQIKKWLLESFKTKANTKKSKLWDRKPLILNCIKNFNLTKEEKIDTSSNSVLTICKARVGQVLSQMISENDLTVDDNKKIKLAEEIKIIYKKEDIEDFILKTLKNQKNLTRNNIYKLCDKKFNDGGTKEDNDKIHLLAGNVLKILEKNKIINKTDGKFTLNIETEYPNTEIGNCLKEAANGKDIYKSFITALNIKGGEFFEVFSAKMLENYFKQSNNIINSSKVTGGPDDNGIDGRIEITDELGYKENVFIQAKIRSKNMIILKEVREFYGALCAEKGTRGIFITNTSFHSAAKKFIKNNNNLIGIDNKKLYELAKKCNIGVIVENNKERLDEKLFLD